MSKDEYLGAKVIASQMEPYNKLQPEVFDEIFDRLMEFSDNMIKIYQSNGVEGDELQRNCGTAGDEVKEYISLLLESNMDQKNIISQTNAFMKKKIDFVKNFYSMRKKKDASPLYEVKKIKETSLFTEDSGVQFSSTEVEKVVDKECKRFITTVIELGSKYAFTEYQTYEIVSLLQGDLLNIVKSNMKRGRINMSDVDKIRVDIDKKIDDVHRMMVCDQFDINITDNKIAKGFGDLIYNYFNDLDKIYAKYQVPQELQDATDKDHINKIAKYFKEKSNFGAAELAKMKKMVEEDLTSIEVDFRGGSKAPELYSISGYNFSENDVRDWYSTILKKFNLGG